MPILLILFQRRNMHSRRGMLKQFEQIFLMPLWLCETNLNNLGAAFQTSHDWFQEIRNINKYIASLSAKQIHKAKRLQFIGLSQVLWKCNFTCNPLTLFWIQSSEICHLEIRKDCSDNVSHSVLSKITLAYERVSRKPQVARDVYHCNGFLLFPG